MSCYEKAIKIKAKIKNAHKTYVAFSGGKDSTAMLLLLLEKGYHIDKILFADTGFEFPELYDYIDKIEKYIKRPITRLKLPKGTWETWFYGKITRGKTKGKIRGFPQIVTPCYWTREAKVKQLEKAQIDAKCVYVGIAYDESHRCSDDEFIKYPLVEWKMTEQDCVDYLNKKELMNPLYKNFNRLGCYFCQKQGLISWWILWKNHKDLWEKARYWENENIKVCGRNIRIKESLRELEKKFENGFVPKMKDRYKCFKCDSVKNAFLLRQAKLKEYSEGENE